MMSGTPEISRKKVRPARENLVHQKNSDGNRKDEDGLNVKKTAC